MLKLNKKITIDVKQLRSSGQAGAPQWFNHLPWLCSLLSRDGNLPKKTFGFYVWWLQREMETKACSVWFQFGELQVQASPVGSLHLRCFALNYRKIGARRQVSILGWFVNMSSGHSCNIVHRDISLNQVKYIKCGSHHYQMVQTFEIKSIGVLWVNISQWLIVSKAKYIEILNGKFYFARMFLLRRRKNTRVIK